MKVLLFSESEIGDILRILASLLHMGNISFKGVVISTFQFIFFIIRLSYNRFPWPQTGNLDASEIPDPSNCVRVAKLLGLDPAELVEALTMKTIFAQGDSVVCLKSFQLGQ